jgi:hypothetical protein
MITKNNPNFASRMICMSVIETPRNLRPVLFVLKQKNLSRVIGFQSDEAVRLIHHGEYLSPLMVEMRAPLLTPTYQGQMNDEFPNTVIY